MSTALSLKTNYGEKNGKKNVLFLEFLNARLELELHDGIIGSSVTWTKATLPTNETIYFIF